MRVKWVVLVAVAFVVAAVMTMTLGEVAKAQVLAILAAALAVLSLHEK